MSFRYLFLEVARIITIVNIIIIVDIDRVIHLNYNKINQNCYFINIF